MQQRLQGQPKGVCGQRTESSRLDIPTPPRDVVPQSTTRYVKHILVQSFFKFANGGTNKVYVVCSFQWGLWCVLNHAPGALVRKFADIECCSNQNSILL